MRQQSKTQARKERELTKIKKELSPFCIICHRMACDAAHLVPRSTFPEHYTNPVNIAPMCRRCHNLYDNNIEFRKQQLELYERVKSFDELAANRYFDL